MKRKCDCIYFLLFLFYFNVLIVLGLGDMVVLNFIGSNVFDILMCFGFFWLLKFLVLEDGVFVKI